MYQRSIRAVDAVLAPGHPNRAFARVGLAVASSFVFRFVPLRVGVDEAGTALAAGVLALGAATGVTLAVVRKARVLCLSAAGVALMLRRGVTPRALADSSLQATDPR